MLFKILAKALARRKTIGCPSVSLYDSVINLDLCKSKQTSGRNIPRLESSSIFPRLIFRIARLTTFFRSSSGLKLCICMIFLLSINIESM
ncbi:MAG: hypothetical protein ACFFAS_20175 [Promethearchaeota archaeon]